MPVVVTCIDGASLDIRTGITKKKINIWNDVFTLFVTTSNTINSNNESRHSYVIMSDGNRVVVDNFS